MSDDNVEITGLGLFDHQDQDDSYDSDYSLDYEFSGPRYSNYRPIDEEGIASDLSDEEVDQNASRFDMWDDDPYNDFTWESNDMQLTKFIKEKQKQLSNKESFWTKEKGWPKQLPYSCSSTNHDQSANAICLVQSNYGLSERIYAVYRDRIIECGRPPSSGNKRQKNKEFSKDTTTWIESNDHHPNYSTHSSTSKFFDTHQSVSVTNTQRKQKEKVPPATIERTEELINQFEPYTKYIKRCDYPSILPTDAYIYPGFDPQCIAYKYGYLAIGGVEGEFELYCCMDAANPVKIWGTKFKGKDNVMLMTNSIQLVRWTNTTTAEYEHMLIGCMNEAGLLFYHLPSHNHCNTFRSTASPVVKLHSHIRSFNGVPINDAKLSPDGTRLVCVGDENMIFMIDVHLCTNTGEIQFGNPIEMVIPPHLFQSRLLPSSPFSSQYVAWSPSSEYFAHTSDSHNLVFIWKTATKEIVHTIDAAGYTYAIAFHPHLENVLVFTNRYGYFQTIEFSTDTVRHEITMVSFRGEVDKRLRILAKINGIEWSKDGNYLYVATKKRVLAYRFSMTKYNNIPKLIDITGIQVKRALEKQEETENSRKRKKLISTDGTILKQWQFIPAHIQFRVLGNKHQLACHY